MRKIILITFLLALPLVCFGWFGGGAPLEPQLTIKADKEVYEEGNEIHIHYLIKNLVNKDLTIVKPDIYVLPSFFKMTPLSFEIKTEKGELLNFPDAGYGTSLRSAMGYDRDDFITLKKHEEVSGNISFKYFMHTVAPHINEIFRYSTEGVKLYIRAIYQGRDTYGVYKQSIGREEFKIDAWMGTLASNTITIEVVEKKGSVPK